MVPPDLIVYTAITAGRDTLKPHPDHPAVDRWLCYTDDPHLHPDGWDIIVTTPRHTPCLDAKWPKCHPPEAARSLWIDGSISITAAWIDTVLAGLEHADIYLFRHPDRTSIVDEAQAAAHRPSVSDPLPLLAQAHHYIDQWGWDDTELWASGTIGRNHTATVLQHGAAWFAECTHWSPRDQLSLPPTLARYGLRPGHPPRHTLWSNPWLTVHPHTTEA